VGITASVTDHTNPQLAAVPPCIGVFYTDTIDTIYSLDTIRRIYTIEVLTDGYSYVPVHIVRMVLCHAFMTSICTIREGPGNYIKLS
jgi:hypothetical protein